MMTSNTSTPTFVNGITDVELHFDDCDWTFWAKQDRDGNLYILEGTYRTLQSEGHIDGADDASDFAPPVRDPNPPHGLWRDINRWEVNFND